MNLLEKLTKLANELDQKGLYIEADTIDALIKSAIGRPGKCSVCKENKPTHRVEFEDGMAMELCEGCYPEDIDALNPEEGEKARYEMDKHWKEDTADDPNKPRDPAGPQPSSPTNLFPKPAVPPATLPPAPKPVVP